MFFLENRLKFAALFRDRERPDSCYAGVVKLVDTLDLGSSASRRGGSSPSTRTIIVLKLEGGPSHQHPIE